MAITPTRKSMAIDTLSAQQADAYFRKLTQTSWARTCLVTLIDLLVNYDRVLVPLPLEYEPSRQDVGDILHDGLKEKWLAWREWAYEENNKMYPWQLVVPDEILIGVFARFERWLEEDDNAVRVQKLIHLLNTSYADPGYDGDPLPSRFWNETCRASIQALEFRFQDQGQDWIRIAFTRIVRCLQYHMILKDSSVYYAHPMRQKLLASAPTIQAAQDRWSWGRYLVWMIDTGRIDISTTAGLMNAVDRLRSETSDLKARWIDLDGKPYPEQRDRIEEVARKQRFPATLSVDGQKRFRSLVNLLGAVVEVGVNATEVALAAPLVKQVFTSAMIAVADKKVPTVLVNLDLLNGHLEWTALFGPDIP
jgi:hypothetical protein